MFLVLNAFLQVALLRLGPEDLPASPLLLAVTAAAYIFVDLLVIAMLYPANVVMPLLLADVMLLLVWCWALLVFFGHLSRWSQTVTAMLGAGALLQVIALPFSVLTIFDDMAALRVAVLVMILLWAIAVHGHILARSLSRSFGIGVMLATVYFVLNFELVSRLTAIN